MNSSQNIISKFGGVRPMARLLNIPVTTIQYWWEEGRIPSKRQQLVLDSALKYGLEVRPEHFFLSQSTRKPTKTKEKRT